MQPLIPLTFESFRNMTSQIVPKIHNPFGNWFGILFRGEEPVLRETGLVHRLDMQQPGALEEALPEIFSRPIRVPQGYIRMANAREEEDKFLLGLHDCRCFRCRLQDPRRPN